MRTPFCNDCKVREMFTVIFHDNKILYNFSLKGSQFISMFKRFLF